ncbi:hypothetical protein NMG60_11029411 [Bertholletia excelsa]
MASSVFLLLPCSTNHLLKHPSLSICELGASAGENLRRIKRFPGISSTTITFASSRFRGRGGCLWSGKSKSNSSRFCCNSQLAELAPAASAVYGVLLLGGGLFAYTRSGSKGSLFGGLTGGSLMAAAYYFMQASETKEIGDALAFGSTLLFACVFGIRLAATRKITPSGLLLGLSICALAVFVSAYLQDRV